MVMRTVSGWVWLALAGCGSSAEPCVLAALDSTAGVPIVHAVSADGTLVAFTAGTDVYVVPATCGGEPVLAVTDGYYLESPRFCGSTLLAFRDRELLAWRPGDAAATSLGFGVDPGATRCARDYRHVSTELDDDDGTPGVTIAVVDTADLSIRTVGVFGKARARFTRDSNWLVYGGLDPGLDCGVNEFTVRREPAAGGPSEHVTCFSADARWEISHDDQWIVYAPAPGMLARRRFDDGTNQVLATNLSQAGWGKAFDLSADGSLIAYITDARGGLAVVPFAGGTPTDLVLSNVRGIKEHYTGLILYLGERPEGHFLFAVSSGGGAPWDLGDAAVVDKTSDAVLTHGRSTYWIPLPTGNRREIAGALAQVALSADDAVIGQRADSPFPIDLIAPESLQHSSLLDETVGPFDETVGLSFPGPFVVEPGRRWLAAVTSTDATSVAILRVPLP